MDTKNEKQIEELSSFWHAIIKQSSYSSIEDKFPRFSCLTTTEIGIISIVSKKPDVILREICSELDVPKSTLTNAIDRLESRKYINRIISKRDKRSFGLELTEEGKLAQKEHISYEKLIYGGLLAALDTDKERQEFLRLLKKIVCNLKME